MFRFHRFQRVALPILLAFTFASVSVRAQSTESFSLSPVVSFTGNSGAAPGSNPEFNLIQASDGNFYGTTVEGGSAGSGTVFKLTPSGVYTLLYSFPTPPTSGYNSPYPSALVEGTDGNFYGVTEVGGALSEGDVYRITPTGVFTELYSFGASKGDLAEPAAGLVQGADGNFYGTTALGGSDGFGGIFEISPSGAYSVVYSFNGSTTGSTPTGGLIEGTDGNFYGTTKLAGASGYGNVFQWSASNGLTVLYSFGGDDGEYPDAGLIQGTDGFLYGTTSRGGASDIGTVFKISTAGAFTSLASFGSYSLDYPHAAPVLGSDGNLYGTAPTNEIQSGGIYQITPSGTFSQVATFVPAVVNDAVDGDYSVGGLLQASDGNFYGLAAIGGSDTVGTIYELAATPALSAPVQLSVSATTYGAPVSVTYSVLNAPTLTSPSTPGTLNQCELYLDGIPYASLIGSPTAATYELTTAQLQALGSASYLFSLTCGGTESSKPVSFTIAPATVTITAQSQSFVYGSVLPTPTYTVSGLQFGQTLSSVASGLPSLTALGVTLTSNVGVYTLAINLGGLICISPCNYEFQFVNGTITVEPLTPVINWPTPPAITYGTGLPAADLNATAYGVAGTGGTSLPGNFVYTETAGTVFHAGQNPLGVAFFPSSPNYAPVSAYTFLTVNQATPVITWPNPASIPYGTPLSSVQLNATANVPGTFFYVAQGVGLNPAGAVLPAGLSALGAGFTPADGLDYAPVSAFALLDVTQQNTSLSILDSTNTATSTGGTATLSVNLAPAGGLTQGKAVPTGSILYLDGGNVIGSGPVGQGISHALTLGKGTHYLAAVYTGDSNYVSSGSNIVVVTF